MSESDTVLVFVLPYVDSCSEEKIASKISLSNQKNLCNNIFLHSRGSLE